MREPTSQLVLFARKASRSEEVLVTSQYAWSSRMASRSESCAVVLSWNSRSWKQSPKSARPSPARSSTTWSNVLAWSKAWDAESVQLETQSNAVQRTLEYPSLPPLLHHYHQLHTQPAESTNLASIASNTFCSASAFEKDGFVLVFCFIRSPFFKGCLPFPSLAPVEASDTLTHPSDSGSSVGVGTF